MKPTPNLQRYRFSHLTQELSIPLQRLHKSLLGLQQSADPSSKQSSPGLAQAIDQIEQMKTILARLLTVQTITLFEEEYVHFCDLVICGSEMAENFLSNQNATKIARQHALYWQRLVKEFKPFLKGVLDYYTHK